MGNRGFSLAATLAAALLLAACGENDASHTLSHLEISGPTKVEYYMGEVFTQAGLTVLVWYKDSTSEELSSADYTLLFGGAALADGAETLTTEPGTKYITVQCGEDWGGMTGQFSVTVKDITIAEVVLIGTPEQKTYGIGEPIDLTGLEVVGIFSNGDEALLYVNPEDIRGFDNSQAGNNLSVKVVKFGRSATFTISVKTLTDRLADAAKDPETNLIKMYADETLTASRTLGGPDAGGDILEVSEGYTLDLTTDGVALSLGDGAVLTVDGTVRTRGSFRIVESQLVETEIGRLLVTADVTSGAAITGKGVLRLAGVDDSHKGYLIAVRDGKKLSVGGEVNLVGLKAGDYDNRVNNSTAIIYVGGPKAELALEGSSKVAGNSNMQSCGGIWVENNASLIMRDSATIANNIAPICGGVWLGGGTLTMEGGSITGNSAYLEADKAGKGGGVYVSGGALIMKGGTIDENSALEGKTLYVKSGTAKYGNGQDITSPNESPITGHE